MADEAFWDGYDAGSTAVVGEEEEEEEEGADTEVEGVVEVLELRGSACVGRWEDGWEARM